MKWALSTCSPIEIVFLIFWGDTVILNFQIHRFIEGPFHFVRGRWKCKWCKHLKPRIDHGFTHSCSWESMSIKMWNVGIPNLETYRHFKPRSVVQVPARSKLEAQNWAKSFWAHRANTFEVVCWHHYIYQNSYIYHYLSVCGICVDVFVSLECVLMHVHVTLLTYHTS